MKKTSTKKALRFESVTVRPLLDARDLGAVAGGLSFGGSCNMNSCNTKACDTGTGNG